MRTVIIGSGAMGSLFGGLLAANGNDVTLIDLWEDHVEAMNENGLKIAAADGPDRTVAVTAITDVTAVNKADLVMLFVKSIHTESAVAGAARLLEQDVDVVTVQNGLGNAETIAEHVPDERIIGGVTSQGAILEEPGRITHAGRGPTVIGRYFQDNDAAVREVADIFNAAGIETTVTEAVRDAVWEKVLINVGINAATALARVRNGAITETDLGRRLADAAVTEARAVAQAEGRTVRNDIVDYVAEIATETAQNKSSMRQDIEAGRRTEIETLNGKIVRRAEQHGIETPVNQTLTDLVRLAERQTGTAY